jgi:hypothetical protein
LKLLLDELYSDQIAGELRARAHAFCGLRPGVQEEVDATGAEIGAEALHAGFHDVLAFGSLPNALT